MALQELPLLPPSFLGSNRAIKAPLDVCCVLCGCGTRLTRHARVLLAGETLVFMAKTSVIAGAPVALSPKDQGGGGSCVRRRITHNPRRYGNDHATCSWRALWAYIERGAADTFRRGSTLAAALAACAVGGGVDAALR
mgnify:CR=1 FL=1